MRNVIVLTLLLFLALPAQAAPTPPLGMITDLQGDVRLVAGPKERKADLLDQVAVGDTLVLEARASCTVTWFSDGHREKVAGPARVSVKASGLTGAEVKKEDPSRALASLGPVAPVGAARTQFSGRGPLDLVVAELPEPALVPAGWLLFGIPVASARVEVRDAQGQVVASDRLMGEFTWQAPKLGADVDYLLEALDEKGIELASRRIRLIPSPPGEDEVIQALEDMARLDKTDPTPWIVEARLFEARKLRALALDRVLQALARRPSAALLRWAADLCEGLERGTEARAYRALADGLE